MTKHWGRYEKGTELDAYRRCLVCGQWRRSWWYMPVPLIHKGGKPKKRKR